MNNLLIANELISYQKDTVLFNAMTPLINDFQKTKNFTTKQIKRTNLSTLILKYTGLDIEFDDFGHQDHASFVFIPDTNRNSVLYDDIRQEYFKNMDFNVLADKNKELNGSVNLKTSKVSGVFSKFKTTIGIGNGFWKKSEIIIFTPEEVAAIILHEIGHVFTSFLFLVESIKTNMVLSSLNRETFFNCSKDKKIKMLKDLKNNTDIKLEDLETLAISDEQIVYSVLISNAMTSPRSDLKTPTYDERTCEFVADQFATMHGAGVYLVSGLQKIMNRYNVVYDKRTPLLRRVHVYFTSLFTYHQSSVMLFASMGVKAIFFMLKFILSFAGFLIYVVIPTITPNLYDPPLIRFNKIKEQYVNALRDRSLTKPDKQRLIKDIEMIDECIKFTGQYPSINNFIYNVLVPWGRKAQSVAKLQNDYESLAYNPFYTASAKMSL